MKTYDHVLNYPLLLLKFTGRHPNINSKIYNLSAVLFLITLVFLLVEVMLQFIFMETNIYDFANNMEPCAGFLQMLIKVVFTLTHKNNIMELIDKLQMLSMRRKWNLPDMESTELTLWRTEKLLKTFGFCVSIFLILLQITPVFTNNLPLGIWEIKGYNNLFKLTLAVQEVGLPFLTAFNSAIDALFLVFFICLVLEFKFLNYSFRKLRTSYISNEIDKQRYFASLKKCIRYHIFLVAYLKKLRDTISPVMFAIYGTVTILLCTEMYIFFESNNIQQLIRRAVAVFYFLLELAFYCIPADYVTSEALAVSEAIYESDWTSEYLSGSRIGIQLVIQQAQLPAIFTAGGLIDMNARTLISVMKVSWSACTIMRALKEK